MKKLMPLFFFALLFAACEDTETNSPALQGEVNDVFFKASDARAVQNEDGTFTLQGTNQDEKLTLHIKKAEPGSFALGEGQSNFATYEDAAGNKYSTSPNGEGRINLTESCISCGTLTGTFRFTAIRPGIDTITVQKGFFYDVSFFEGGLIDPSGQINAGTLDWEVDDVPFSAATVSTTIVDETLVAKGAVGDKIIRIKIPLNAPSSNHSLPETGYEASYTVDGVTEQAEAGLISVNYNNGTRTLVFFNFETANHSISSGNMLVNY